ncbi:restriction endonuclease [Microbacterium sp. MYb72]|nr:restriction endonuclease [Microbacterium sp. MYb72]
MEGQASFALRAHNPDVLTCIANLSNDEVFTPPELANQMLDTVAAAWADANDGADIWKDPDVTFLDPFTKSGVFLREIVARLTDGLADKIPDLQDRVDHILTKQVYGIGITQLTALLARRSVYCSKDATGEHSAAKSFGRDWGNIWFERTEHTWSGEKCAYCGATKRGYDRDEELESHAYAFIHTLDPRALIAQLFGANMQFDVIIGNPPYQLDDGGYGTSAAPIYQLFVERAKALDPRYLTMIVPSRWFAGGKGLDEFRDSMLHDDRVRVIDDYLSASDVFPGVGLKGGVCYFLWDRDHRGLCQVTTRYAGWTDSSAQRPLLEMGADIFVRFNQAVPILKKVVSHEGGSQGTVVLPEDRRFNKLVSSSRPFGLRTFFKGKTDRGEDDLLVYQNGGTAFMSRSDLLVGSTLVDSWKVYVGAAAPGTGNKDTYPHRVLSTPFLGEPGSVCSETYLCIGPIASKEHANNALTYLRCRFTRFLIQLHKATQHTSRKVYTFVPMQDFSRPWTDADLYEKYGITDDEIAFIERVVRPMESVNA